ncbi:hypothetical protein MTO96_013292 [Rhipicephalus appendiculatus]
MDSEEDGTVESSRSLRRSPPVKYELTCARNWRHAPVTRSGDKGKQRDYALTDAIFRGCCALLKDAGKKETASRGARAQRWREPGSALGASFDKLAEVLSEAHLRMGAGADRRPDGIRALPYRAAAIESRDGETGPCKQVRPVSGSPPRGGLGARGVMGL